MKKTILLLFTIFTFLSTYAQIPPGYYDAAAGLNGQNLKNALHNIIDAHSVISYSALFSVFDNTDNKGNNIVWDIYSDNPFGNPPYVYYYTNPADQCGQYNSEGDCYNKEHAWPHSWLGSTSIPAYSDLFHVYPTDGWVNNKRGNMPYGEVNNASWTSQNGSKIGSCVYPGYNGQVFEPIDEYKGDIARSYFYITVRYMGEDGSWPGSDQTTGAELKPWAYNLMYDWHKNDPVSQKETDRNDAIYALQNNRNPFIDNPNWVDSILFPVGIINKFNTDYIDVYPNPTNDFIHVAFSQTPELVELYDATGRLTKKYTTITASPFQIDIESLPKGFYILKLQSGHISTFKSIIKL